MQKASTRNRHRDHDGRLGARAATLAVFAPTGPGRPARAPGGAEPSASSRPHHRPAAQPGARRGRRASSADASPIVAAAAAGLGRRAALERPADDWEPAIAADPNVALGLRDDHPLPARSPVRATAPTPYIVLRRSNDGGRDLEADQFLCACQGQGPVRPDRRGRAEHRPRVRGLDERLRRRVHEVDEQRRHWSTPVKTYGNVCWNDKPVLAVSDDGQHVYVSWNGPSGGDP